MKTSLVQTLSRYTVCLFLLAVSVLPAFGQQPKPNLNVEMKVEPGTEPPVEPEVKPEYKVDYARRHTLELSYGTSKNLKTYHHLMDKGITQAGASKVGLDGLLRYSFFASRHWGAFVQVENSLFWVDELEMNPAAKKTIKPAR